MSLQPGNDYGFYPELLEDFVEIVIKKTAVSALDYNQICGAVYFIDNLVFRATS